MLKISKNVKKIIASIILILTIFSITQPVFAAAGSGQFVGGQYDSGMKTTDNQNTNKGVMIRRLINNTTGEKITTFCAEYSVNFKSGVIYNGEYYTPTDSTIKRACKIAYFGWYSKYPDYVIDGGILAADMKWVKQDYVFTQQFIWETLGQSNATFIDSTIQNQYIAFKNDINNKIENMQKQPSFCGKTITVNIGEKITLTDANGVLADYESIDKTSKGIRFVHNKGQNTMNITVGNECTLENYNISEQTMKEWGLIKSETRDNDTTVYFAFEDGVQNQFYAMNYNDPVTMSMNLHINLFGKLELTKLNKYGQLIDGAIFEINGPNNFSKEVTVTNGKIIVNNLKRGTYTIKEKKAPHGYLIDTKTYIVDIIPNYTTIQAITNEMPTGIFTLIKKNADGNATLEGAKYRIWNNNGYDKEFTTNNEGKIVVTGLKMGTYNYQEIQAPNGYLLDTNTYSFELTYKDQNTNVIYANEEKTNEEPIGTISIIKKDAETGDIPQGDATFANATYEVYANEDIYNKAKTKKFYSKGDLVETRSMNEYGTTSDITGLPLGKYIVKETVASNGYLLDKNQYQVNLQYKDQNTKIISESITSLETVKKMQVHIFKTGINEDSGLVAGLAGAEFTIKLYSDVEKAYKQGYSYDEIWNGIVPTYDIITTDANGNAYTKEKLPYGKYIVKETKVPQNFIGAEDFTFSITQDESEIQEVAQKVKHLVVNNKQLQTYIKLIKKDLKTGKTVTLSSSTFEIKATEDIYDVTTGEIMYPKGQAITQKIGSTTYSSFTTNADNIVVLDNSFNTASDEKGTVTTPLLLPAGSYEITEIKVPEGFLQLEKPIALKIESIKDFDRNQNGDYIKEIIIENEQPTGSLIVNKNIVNRKNGDTSLIDIGDLSGIEFKLTAKEDIIDYADGSVIYKKEQKVNTYNLDKNGDLKIENLPMGIYELQEVKTLEGLVLDKTKHEVRFVQNDLITKVYTEKKEITNYTIEKPILKTIKIIKADSETNETIKASFKFGIYENFECTKLIEEVESNQENGTITFENLKYGTYYIKEIQAPNGYFLSNKILKIEINDKGIFADGELLNEDNSICTITYYNQPIPLIQAGNNRNYPLLLSSLLIGLSGTIFLISKNKFFI